MNKIEVLMVQVFDWEASKLMRETSFKKHED